MPKLTDEFLKEQKEKLMLEKARLEKELKVLEKFPEYGDQEEDNTEEVDDFYTSTGEDKEMLMIYKQIKKALKKIENGSYDICDNCKKHIPLERLKALPWATVCLDCER